MAAPPSTVPASRRVYEHVRRGLVEGTHAEGELLSEGAVAAEVGVSRTPVREAFLQLEAEGLLTLYPRRGALVVPVTVGEARDLFAARALVEADALRTVLRTGVGGALVDELHGIVDEQRALRHAGDLVASADADRRLHRAWVAAAGNAVLLRFFDGLRDRQERMTVAMLRRGGVRPERLVDEHEAIVDAVADGDADLAARLVAEHLDAARVAAFDG